MGESPAAEESGGGEEVGEEENEEEARQENAGGGQHSCLQEATVKLFERVADYRSEEGKHQIDNALTSAQIVTFS